MFHIQRASFPGCGGVAANPAVLLAAAAARTSRIRLGPCIAVLPLRHPLHTAEDWHGRCLSAERLEFVIGSDDTEMDYRVCALHAK
jgi:alkanesulfonate monooxygenase SsuD/methylene tetrahydromethanopterin reductase-like flavin-dependent oxidoreductase (luciferase family)